MKRFSQRAIVLGLLVVYCVFALLLVLASLRNFWSVTTLGSLVGGVSFGVLAYAYWRGWEPAGLVALVTITLLTSITIDVPQERMPIEMMIVPVMALIMGGPLWILGLGLFQIVVCVVRAYMIGGPGGMGTYGTAAGLLLYVMPVIGLVLGRLMLDNVRRVAEENARQASAARAEAEAKSAALAGQAADLSQRNDEQARLLELIAELETPSVPLAEGVVLAPVVGALDSRRAESLTTRLLREVSDRRTHHVVLDIAGVAHIDTEVAGGMLRLVQALRLLGCAVTLTGISVSVASSLSQLGVSFGDVQVARSPQDVLAVTAR